jgi:hypothetical protein
VRYGIGEGVGMACFEARRPVDFLAGFRLAALFLVDRLAGFRLAVRFLADFLAGFRLAAFFFVDRLAVFRVAFFLAAISYGSFL